MFNPLFFLPDNRKSTSNSPKSIWQGQKNLLKSKCCILKSDPASVKVSKSWGVTGWLCRTAAYLKDVVVCCSKQEVHLEMLKFWGKRQDCSLSALLNWMSFAAKVGVSGASCHNDVAAQRVNHLGHLMKEKSKSAKMSCCSAVRMQVVRGRVRTGLRRVNSMSKLLTSFGALMTGRKGGFTFLARRASQSIPC